MTTTIMTLTDWIIRNVEADEAVARYAASLGADFIGYDTGDRGDAWRGHAGPHDPARVLAECEAKRRIVDLAYLSDEEGACVVYDRAIRALAAVYADRPGYDERWAV